MCLGNRNIVSGLIENECIGVVQFSQFLPGDGNDGRWSLGGSVGCARMVLVVKLGGGGGGGMKEE